LARYPPSIDLSNKLLSSVIPLPPNVSIDYAVFSPTTSTAPHPDTFELARRHILDTRKPSILESLLCTVYVEKGAQQLYVFLVVSSDGANDSLTGLQFDGLISESSDSIFQSLRAAPFDLFMG
jgi:mediator of RNA polymerase II transcription subunit 13, fungi type